MDVEFEGKYVDGMPLKTVIAMLQSPRTPPWLKKAWLDKLERLGYSGVASKLSKVV